MKEYVAESRVEGLGFTGRPGYEYRILGFHSYDDLAGMRWPIVSWDDLSSAGSVAVLHHEAGSPGNFFFVVEL